MNFRIVIFWPCLFKKSPCQKLYLSRIHTVNFTIDIYTWIFAILSNFQVEHYLDSFDVNNTVDERQLRHGHSIDEAVELIFLFILCPRFMCDPMFIVNAVLVNNWTCTVIHRVVCRCQCHRCRWKPIVNNKKFNYQFPYQCPVIDHFHINRVEY